LQISSGANVKAGSENLSWEAFAGGENLQQKKNVGQGVVHRCCRKQWPGNASSGSSTFSFAGKSAWETKRGSRPHRGRRKAEPAEEK